MWDNLLVTEVNGQEDVGESLSEKVKGQEYVGESLSNKSQRTGRCGGIS